MEDNQTTAEASTTGGMKPGRQSRGPSGARKGNGADTTCQGTGPITGTQCIHGPLTGWDAVLHPPIRERAVGHGTGTGPDLWENTVQQGGQALQRTSAGGVDRITKECNKSSNDVTSYRGIMVVLKRSSIIVNNSCFPSLAGRPLPARPSREISPLIVRTRENTQKAKQLDLTHSG